MANKKALSISGLLTFAIFSIVAVLILGLIFKTIFTLIAVGIALGVLLVIVFFAGTWEALYEKLDAAFSKES